MSQLINSENFEALCNTGKVVVVDFWAPWCGPCKRMAPIIEQLAEEYEGKAITGKCDIEEDDKLPVQFSVRSIPTIIFVKDGKVADKQIGLCPKAVLEDKLKALL